MFYFNIALDNISLDHALARLQQYLRDGRQHYVVTPNPEMVVLAKTDLAFRAALNEADLCLIDGFGLSLILRLLSGHKIYRLPGTDFFIHLLKTLGPSHSFFFFGSEHGTSIKAAKIATKRYHTRVVGRHEPRRGLYAYHNKIKITDTNAHHLALAAIRAAQPEILIVALGHNLQEKWLHAYLREPPSVKIAIGVGGALDYLSGQTSRAPAFLRTNGLEWLWRLFFEPWRWRRIFTATIIFPLTAISWYARQRFRYRSNVVGCVINNKDAILLVSRSDDPTHWQFPQGGQENDENPAEAILREMHEELGTDKLKIIGQSRPNVHRYDWPRGDALEQKSTSTISPFRHYSYRGQRQTIFYLRFLGSDADLKIDHREHAAWQWVKPEELLHVLHPVRQAIGKIVLNEFHAKH